MGDHDIIPTCLSDEPHDNAIQDPLLHYMGCVELSRQANFYSMENELWAAKAEKQRQAREGVLPGQQSEEDGPTVEGLVANWNSVCENEINRIYYLRKALDKDPNEAHLVDEVNKSLAKWRASEEYNAGRPVVLAWREQRRIEEEAAAKLKAAKLRAEAAWKEAAEAAAKQEAEAAENEAVEAASSEGSNSRSLQSEQTLVGASQNGPGQRGFIARRPAYRGPSQSIRSMESVVQSEGENGLTEYDPDKDVNAFAIQYEDDMEHDREHDRESVAESLHPNEAHPRLKKRLPDQRLKIDVLLEETTNVVDPFKLEEPSKPENPLPRDVHPDRIKFIHLPANNMMWVEKAISKYYGKSRPDYDGIHRELTGVAKTEPYMILRPQYWRGQQHGGRRTLPHARHMRPLCETISEDPKTIQRTPQNIVLFMPYLHWETDRQRHRFAEHIEKITEEHDRGKVSSALQVKQARKSKRDGLTKPKWIRDALEAEAKRRVAAVEKKKMEEQKQKKMEEKKQEAEKKKVDKEAKKEAEKHDPKAALMEMVRALQGELPVAESGAAVATQEGSFCECQKCNSEARKDGHRKRPHPHTNATARRPTTLKSLVSRLGYGNNKLQINARGRVAVPNALGQYLIDAARLYEGMSSYRDKKLLQKYLHEDPPLHPRRTLDQAYYWTLNTTKTRDRDQVVYRGTTAKAEDFHAFDLETRDWPAHRENEPDISQTCEQCTRQIKEMRDLTQGSIRRACGDCRGRWGRSCTACEDEAKQRTGDEEARIRIECGECRQQFRKSCEECRDQIRKISRIVMVDQLWMWILDQKTIITCFPRRYGANKQDPSGVHKSIRLRLHAARENQIRSVFDLALIIFDECSNTFFDRTKTADRQPQVIDQFSEAIGNVTNKQTAAFERLWHWTEEASKVYRSKGKLDTSDLHVPLLDINPEGKLQKEIKDILEELDIMIMISRTHKDVLKDFIRHVEHILDPDGIFSYNNWHRHRRMGTGAKHLPKPPAFSGDHHQPKGKDAAEHAPHQADTESRKMIYEWFEINADELLGKVVERIEELEQLKRSADTTSNSLKDLLALKQQQASVVQAWQSVKQSEEAVSQGRSIMMFTVVTIIFLPLSFMAAVFGMNAAELTGDDSLPIAQEFKYMFPISISVIIVTLILAFSTSIRSVIYICYRVSTTWLFTSSGIYARWLDWDGPRHLAMQRAVELTDQLKERVKKRRLELRREEWQHREAVVREARKKREEAEEEKKKKQNAAGERDAATASGTDAGARGGGLFRRWTLRGRHGGARPGQTNKKAGGSASGGNGVAGMGHGQPAGRWQQQQQQQQQQPDEEKGEAGVAMHHVHSGQPHLARKPTMSTVAEAAEDLPDGDGRAGGGSGA